MASKLWSRFQAIRVSIVDLSGKNVKLKFTEPSPDFGNNHLN